MPYSNSKKKRNMKRVKSKRAKKLKKRRSQKGGMFGWAFGKKTENVDDESKPKSIFSGLNFLVQKSKQHHQHHQQQHHQQQEHHQQEHHQQEHHQQEHQ